MNKLAPIALDLFSGCGGLTLGLKWAGFNVVGAIEVDDISVETYRRNHPRTRIWHRDIRNVDTTEVMRDLLIHPGELSLLAGCPPCQGFSHMRTRNGSLRVGDARNDLVFEFLRFVEALRPKAFMMENVPALMTDVRMSEFRTRLRNIDYSYECDILNAADYGVPQRRERMVLLGGRCGEIGIAKPSLDRRTVRDAIGDMPIAGTSGDPLHDVGERRSERIMNLIRNIPRDGGSRTALGEDFQLKCHKTFSGFYDVYGRMAWDDVAPTITGGCFNPSKGRFLHPEQDRAITLREATLLQSFPNDYFISLSRGKEKAAELIGNAWPPEFIRHIASRVKEYVLSN